MNLIDKNMTIGSVVATLPESKSIFSEYGIDYCCGGNRKLSEVFVKQNLNENEIIDKLNAAQKNRESNYKDKENDFTKMSAPILSSYIEDKHHSYLRQVLPAAAELLETILRVHGKNHRELFEVYRLFGSLKTDLEQHLLKEETMLFPALSQEDSTREDIIGLTTEIINEHVAAGDTLSELRTVTKEYAIPEDACRTYQMAYQILEEIEDDLHQHIHLENNILLKEYDIRTL
jgi:regulator of cell morphogenesis and NO signaling